MCIFSWRRPPDHLLFWVFFSSDFDYGVGLGFLCIYLFILKTETMKFDPKYFFSCFETLITLMTVFFVRYILLEIFITYNDTFCSKVKKLCYIYIFYLILLYNQIIVLLLSYKMTARVRNCGVSIRLCSFANLVPFS